jgi:protein-glutamine gamma-glutamyltransferase
MKAFDRDTGWRLMAFAGLTALAAWRYVGVQEPAPTARAVGLAVLAVAAAAVLVALRGRRRAAARAVALVLALGVGAVIAGVPLDLLAPARWGILARHLHTGSADISGTLWPYSGGDRWTRLDLLLLLVLAPVAAAALAFWPPRMQGRLAAVRAWVRRLAALVLLLLIYVLGLLDSNGGSVTAEGLLVLVLVVAWWWRPPWHRRRAAAALAWLVTAGAAAVVATGVVATDHAWLGYRGWNLLGTAENGISFSWNQTYGPLRWSRSALTMFTVTTGRPQLWKTTTLDRFDGVRFERSDTPPPSDGDLPLPLNDRWYRFVRFKIAGLRSDLLPAEQGVTAGVQIRATVQYEPDGTVTTTQAPLDRGATYTVMSYVPAPTRAELRSAPRTMPADYRAYIAFSLPGSGAEATVTARDQRRILASPYAAMYRLARRLAGARQSRYDVALAIERYLRANETYDEQVSVRRYPLEAFLFTDHIGDCQQFSGAMALMLRMDGIPARIAAGFLPGAYDTAAGQWVVRAVDAHEWVEVYFSGIGWVPFDPTPPRLSKAPQRPLFTSQRAATESQMQAIAATVGGPLPASPAHRTGRRAQSGGLGLAVIIAGVIAIVALAALVALVARWLSGLMRLRRSLAGDGEVAAWELVSALRRLGYAVPPTATLSWIETVIGLHAGADAAQYVRNLRECRYAPGPGASPTLAQRRRLRHGVTVRLGLAARLRGLWALPPGTVAWGASHPGDHSDAP